MFCPAKRHPPKFTQNLGEVYHEQTIAVTNVWQWVNRFKKGHTSVLDRPRTGRPVTASTSDTIHKVNTMIQDNRRIRIEDISIRVNCSVGTVVGIIRQLGYHKVCARWVPKELTQQQKSARKDISSTLLNQYREAGEEFFRGVVTGDETWVHHYEPETKRQSMHWKHPQSPTVRKFKTGPSAGKVMATIFWDKDGILLVDFLEPGRTINSDRYIQALRKLKRAIRDKRPGIDIKDITIHHDNARPHTSKATAAELAKLGWTVMPHPPYSPDLAPSDFHLFGPLKNFLRGQHFTSDEEVKSAVRNWCRSNDQEFIQAGFQRWVERWEKCVLANGDWVEK